MIIVSVVRAVELWISVFPFTVAGILLASIAVEFGIFDRLFPVVKPILHSAHFTPHSGIVFITAFGSPIAAVAMLSEFYGEGKIDQKETLLATVATWFPQTIYESLVYISPTIIPVLGVVGIAYLSLFLLNGTIVALLVFIAGRALLTRKDCTDCASAPETEGKKLVVRTALKRSVLNSVKLLKRVVLVAFPVSILVFVLIDLGAFDALSQYLGWMPLPPEALAIIPLVVANPTAAYITIADLIETEVLDFKLALLTLLTGNLLVSTRYILTHRLPYYSGIFGPVLSLKIISVSACLRLGLTVLMILTLVLAL
ncbi:hypothetical protein FXV91_09850 [Methanosarcina sp. DH2]|jgi:hypothetical protein|uniref:nucleoside recognition domain-containing protein n=1 Tax=Methanosarcina sp. DH2 TaxID=2605639 RepID=UPI001E48F1D6|nr:nucleoside recognition domain-containing protein [Methanosarcina sp. DH2]MCC4770477.1 hypothetical protein [Methanosarcina sp. DH2]